MTTTEKLIQSQVKRLGESFERLKVWTDFNYQATRACPANPEQILRESNRVAQLAEGIEHLIERRAKEIAAAKKVKQP
jgi:hypothetical protein